MFNNLYQEAAQQNNYQQNQDFLASKDNNHHMFNNLYQETAQKNNYQQNRFFGVAR